mmetsp:Transcript_8432/g.21627  ORF Transcript_8432/g.21627 Transcript_8432/m.21627 type:complete len:205 (+) Transcript_8432:393-1007(+)
MSRKRGRKRRLTHSRTRVRRVASPRLWRTIHRRRTLRLKMPRLRTTPTPTRSTRTMPTRTTKRTSRTTLRRMSRRMSGTVAAKNRTGQLTLRTAMLPAASWSRSWHRRRPCSSPRPTGHRAREARPGDSSPAKEGGSRPRPSTRGAPGTRGHSLCPSRRMEVACSLRWRLLRQRQLQLTASGLSLQSAKTPRRLAAVAPPRTGR